MAALEPLGGDLDVAILYGSVAKSTETSRSDVDLLLVSEALTMEAVYRALEPAEAQLGRRISPTLYDPTEFRARRESIDTLIAEAQELLRRSGA